jgi:Ricin-type beta-trefoil lectin domain-like
MALKRMTALVAVLASAVLLTVAAPAHAVPLSSGHIVFQHSGKCADLPRWNTNNGVQLDQWACVNQENERWDIHPLAPGLFWVQNYHSGKCMNVRGASRSNGAAVIQWSCSRTATNSLWRLDGYRDHYRLRNINSSLCLNVAAAAGYNGAWLIQYRCGSYPNETFRYT